MMQLRHYQRAAVDCLWAHLRAHDDNPCIVLPTAAGKSPTMAAIIREALAWPGTRICVLAHVKELVEQNADKLGKYWPDMPVGTVGVNSASLKRRDCLNPVIFAQIQSVHNKAMQLGWFDLLLIDEAHRIPVSGDGMYRKLIDALKAINPNLRVIGLTATPYRLGVGPVCGPEYVLNSICYEAGIRDLINQGFLCKLVSKAGIAQPDMTSVQVRGGEYVESAMQAAVDKVELVESACDEMLRYGSDRKAWILFCASVKHGEHVRDALRVRGITAELVHGGTPESERSAAIARFQRKRLQALVNVNVFSEGFDATHVDMVCLLRPTKSPGLYVQQVGRGLRLDPSKTDCLILDFAGNIIEHGPIDEIRVQRPRKRGEKAEIITAPTKACPQCQSFVGVSVTVCPDCGFVFPRAIATHDPEASSAPILAGECAAKVFTHDVRNVRYARHEKVGSSPTLRVTYESQLQQFREWVCLEHSGPIRARACGWWMQRLPAEMKASTAATRAVPVTVDGALMLTKHLRVPVRIRVNHAGKYPEVVGYEFEENENGTAAHGADPARENRNAGFTFDSAADRRTPPGAEMPGM